MSSNCCDADTVDQLAISGRRKTLYVVLGINVLMFAAELGAGIWADSKALIADSADNLGDSLVYAMSLFVVARSVRWRAGTALVKGLIQLAFGLGIMISIVVSLLGSPQPLGVAMVSVAAIALISNVVCLGLLMKHRNEDINMRSVWLCSRNDVIGNLGVIISGGLVMLLDSFWPDIIVASLVAVVFLHTAYEVLRDAVRSWRINA
ncbi:MAG: cation transporter [Porticoccus sp.]|jgi:cation diffusion facilitator family transporter|uniref:cation transporter n=1 Tax=Porticoccus sp. TaxID=2024853 RepID=UPI00329703D0|tara:strand:+ start:2871 stop:3488 length:618 start_codon:yes stop_codon:yes gene_type:complete